MRKDTFAAVMQLATDRPDWIRVLRAACEVARQSEATTGIFAGSYVLTELARESRSREWRPNLRLIAAYGLLEKVGESTRSGNRAYYRMPDREGVEQALTELDRRRAQIQME